MVGEEPRYGSQFKLRGRAGGTPAPLTLCRQCPLSPCAIHRCRLAAAWRKMSLTRGKSSLGAGTSGTSTSSPPAAGRCVALKRALADRAALLFFFSFCSLVRCWLFLIPWRPTGLRPKHREDHVHYPWRRSEPREINSGRCTLDPKKSSQVKVYSSRRQKEPYAEAVGQTGAQGLVRRCGPHCPPVSREKVGPGVGPTRPVTNDRDRRRSPRLFFLPFCYFF